MLFGDELNSILKDFYINNKSIVHNSLAGSLVNFTVESIIIKRLMAKLFINITDPAELKRNIYKLIGAWIANQGSYAIADKLHSKLEPALTKYLTDVIINAIFIKYQNTNMGINTGIIFSKIAVIRWNIETLINSLILVLIPRIITIYITIFNFYMVNKKIGLCALLVVSIQLFIVFSNFEKCINVAHEELDTKDEIMDIIEDKFNNIHTITSVLNGIKTESKKCSEKSSEFMNKRIAVLDCVLDRQISGYSTNTIVFIIILFYSYKLYEIKEINIEQFITILTTLEGLFTHVYEITYIFPDITTKIGVLNSNKKFMSELFSHKMKDGEDIKLGVGKLKFRDVSFSYGLNLIFNKLNLDIDNGITTIYGKSGSGKSTLIKLICDILKPNDGQITIDDIDINKLSLDCINKNIIYISQNTATLFNTTIYENIIYGLQINDNSTKSNIMKLIKKYNLFSIFENINKEIAIKQNTINDTSDNYNFFDYIVGKKGELLSGGQKQIVHIIRSVLNNLATVFIYDEPTSALDNNVKNNVISMIKNELKNKTIIIVTHDNSIRQYSNKIIDFDTLKK